jgi:hypothetical protein
MPTSERTYPALCYSCGKFEGRPTRLETGKANQVRIQMCCHACDSRWEDVITLPAQS